MGHLSCLFKNGAEGCKTAGVEGAWCLQGWGGHIHRPGTGFLHWALAVALWGWEEGSFEPRNGANGYGMGLGVHGFLIPLCKASQPRLSRGWTETCPGCLWCFGLYLLLFHCRHHESMATHLHIWRPLNTALGIFWCSLKTFLLSSYSTLSISSFYFFCGDVGTDCPYKFSSPPFPSILAASLCLKFEQRDQGQKGY